MKKYILLILLFGVFVAGFAQQKKGYMEDNKEKTIKLSENLLLHQKQENINDTTVRWSLILQRIRDHKTELVLETKDINTKINNPITGRWAKSIDIMIKNDMILKFPNLIDAFRDEKKLYIILYKQYAAVLQVYEFSEKTNYTKKEYPLLPIGGGSVANFGSYGIVAYKHKINKNEYFMYVYAGRELLSHNFGLFCINADNELNKIEFSETPKEIPDEKRIFREMDFEKPDSYMKISKAIESVLTESGKIKPNPKFTFKYLWCFDLNNYYRHDGGGVRQKGTTYFFYQEDYPYSKVKVIRYDNYEFTWLLDEYKEQIIESVK